MYYAGVDGLIVFPVVTIALGGLAWLVALGTEGLGAHLGPAVTGVMQSTLGNLPELFVVVFALKAGQVVVAQTSILGSLFANALLVLGGVILIGARAADDGVMRFSARLPNDTATLLLLANFIIVVIAVALSSHDPASRHVNELSTVGAICLLVVYLAWVLPYVRGEQGVAPGEGEHSARVPLAVSATLLALAGIGAAFVADWFIHAL